MVARIAAAGLVSDPRVLEALATVPRHLFVPKALAAEAYGDHALPIGAGQTITQAANVGRAAELAAIRPGGRVLEVGTGSGYQAAVLAQLAGQVFSLERIPEGQNYRLASLLSAAMRAGLDPKAYPIPNELPADVVNGPRPVATGRDHDRREPPHPPSTHPNNGVPR